MVNTQSLPELNVPVLGVQQPRRADAVDDGDHRQGAIEDDRLTTPERLTHQPAERTPNFHCWVGRFVSSTSTP